ncbi:hypothetical protein [Candidatus Amarolinea aalborgensis]|jgi:hypothetical protein|uniref:hypothetical protein n=1 Tax=Candidatus Amarolinea aalborgensis TaxID=2249329 RepID=UPI003BFA1C42
MAQNTLLLIEATRIQDYIFGSNELKQIIGASELVQQATQDWVFAALAKLPLPVNVQLDAKEPDGWKITAPLLAGNWAAQVIYAGGGNAVILFANPEEARKFARELSFKVLRDAPGLLIIETQQPFDPTSQSLKDELNNLRKAAAQRKRTPPRSAPLLGLGVTAACVYTGAPAVDRRDRRWISREAQFKQDAAKPGETRLRRHLRDIQLAGFGFISDFDQLGERGEASYMALIHTDGNGMGQRIEKHGQEFSAPADNEKYAQAQHAFSEKVKEVARIALNRTVGMLLHPANQERDDKGRLSIRGKAPMPRDREDRTVELLPFRPIVFGGDDVTFVSEGRIGLSIAARYIGEFAAQSLADGKPAAARAGVAVVKSHYPFARAYDLADELCVSAKGRVKELSRPDLPPTVTALDWHFAVSGLVLPLAEIREREYSVRDGSLLMRPVALHTAEGDWRSWEAFTETTLAFQEDKEWRGQRNKVKALRDALRGGPDAVKLFLPGKSLPQTLGTAELADSGWDIAAKRCGYFDAVEALDFYVRLEGESV